MITVVKAGIQTEHLLNVVKSVAAILNRLVVLSDLNRIIAV
jgi:hypothetical protein